MPATEQELADAIDSSELLGKDGNPKLTGGPSTEPAAGKKPAKEAAPEPDETDDLEEPEGDEHEQFEELEDEQPKPKPKGRRTDDDLHQTIASLRTELEEMKKTIVGGGRPAASTGKPEGAAAPSGESANDQDKAVESAFSKVRAKMAAARDTWGELMDAVGLDDLVGTLEAREKAQRDAQQQAEQREQEARQQQMVEAANGLHKYLNDVARGDTELMSKLGIGLHGTLKPQHIQTRSRIFNAATRALEDSRDDVDAGLREKPLTEAEALDAGIQRVTGKKLKARSAGDDAAKDRARHLRPGNERNTSKDGSGQETHADIENRLAREADAFMKQYQR